VTDWLEECRGAVGDLREVFEGMPARADREAILRAGVGGDDTTAIDDAAERKIVERLERLHAAGESFTLVSEELGERRFGDGGSRWVVVDPVDGSVNAKRGIPFFSLSVAVAGGPTMGDVDFGYVHDFGSGEEWTAVRGEGARLNGEPIPPESPKDEIEILSFEATRTVTIAERVGGVVGLAERLRIMGSLAISLCHLAAGRVDAVCSLKGARSVDIAAAQLLVRECGLAIDLPEAPPFEAAPLDLEGRSRVVAGASPEVCARLFAALSA
jgi:myo-inositol-1(or 4)-monophosphatase